MYNQISEQWEKMIARGMIPVFEFHLSDDESIVVDLELVENVGIIFEFDSEGRQTYFSGNVEKYKESDYSFILKFNEFEQESLDSYLQEIHNEVVEGFLIPNNINQC